MTLDSLFKEYAAFNDWANAEVVNWLQSKPRFTVEREIPSSFPSLPLTLLHIWGAEKLWMERLQRVPAPVFLTQVFQGTTEDIFAGILLNSSALANYIAGQGEEFFQEICHFRLLNGTEDNRPRAQMLLHAIQHSTYHRGQIITMARNLGLIDPPSTDFIRYVRIKGEL